MIKDVIHQQKKCQVVIKKPKVKVFNWYAMIMGAMRTAKTQKQSSVTMQSMIEYIYKETYNKYAKYITSDLSQFKKVKDSLINKHKVLYDPNPTANRYDVSDALRIGLSTNYNLGDEYYYIVSDNGFVTDELEKVTSITNGRVLSTQVEQRVEGLWTATIELDNSQDYFLLKDTAFDSSIDFAEGESIIEANDEIIIYTSNNQGDYKKIFTGYVGLVTSSDDGLNKRINLVCQDKTKKLAMDRIMTEPSLTPWTNEGINITPFANLLIPQPPAELLARLLYATYCEYYKDTTFVSAMDKVLEIANKNTAETVNIVQLSVALKNLQNIIKSLFEKYVTIEYELNDNGNPATVVLSDGTVIPKIIGFTGYKQSEDNQDREIVFSINNLDQPVWQWQFNNGAYNIYTSEYKTHNEVISTIAKSVFYEFYADVNGIIRFCPTNLSFPDKINDDSAVFVEGMGDFPDIYNAVTRNYIILREDEKYITSMAETNNDTNIFTDITISGQYQVVPGQLPYLRAECVSSWDIRGKYGIRMAGSETRIGYQTIESVESYGRAKLLRLNAQHWTANIQMHGNADIFPGMPIFIERWLSLYYITSVVHNFVAGQSYTMSINLAYKRTPIALEVDTGNSPLSYISTKNWLNIKLNNNIIYKDFYDIIWDNRAFLTWGKLKYTDGAIYCMVWNYIPTDFKPSTFTIPNLIQKQDVIKNSIIKLSKKFKASSDQATNRKKTSIDIDNNNNNNSMTNTFAKAKNTPSILNNKYKVEEKVKSLVAGQFIPAQQLALPLFTTMGAI